MPIPKSTMPAKLTVDFSGADIRRGGGGGDNVPEGDYLLQVVGCTFEDKKDDPSKHYLRWKNTVVKPTSFAGKVIFNNTSLQEENLWQLRTFLVDLLGESKVPKSKVDLPIAAIVAKKPQFGATIGDGKPYGEKQIVKSEIKQTYSKADYNSTSSDADEDEDEATPEAATTAAEGEDMDEIDIDDI